MRLSLTQSVALTIICGILGTTAISVPLARADDAKELLEASRSLYTQRTDPAKVDEAIGKLKDAEVKVAEPDLKYDVLTFSAKVLGWKASHTSNSESKLALFQSALDKADAARKLNDSWADAYYWYGTELSGWAQAKSLMVALNRKDEITGSFLATLSRKTRDGKEGESLDGYGPDRALGRLFYKLPVFAGGNHDRSVDYLNKAWTGSPETCLNAVYLADTLIDRDETETARARILLRELAAKLDPLMASGHLEKYNAERVPETQDEIIRLHQLLKELGK